MNKFVIGMGVVVLAVAGWMSTSAEEPKDKPKDQLRDFMHAKLGHSQKVLEGLTMEDFELVAKHSQELSLLSQAAQWQVLQTPDYLHHSKEFRHVANRLTAAAQKKNLEGATLAYMELTMECVHCHKYVRGERDSIQDIEPPLKRLR